MGICNTGKYLGIWIGPKAGDRNWKDPMAKLVKRTRKTAAMDVGSLTSKLRYNTRCLPVELYLVQLIEKPPCLGRFEINQFVSIFSIMGCAVSNVCQSQLL